MSRGKRMPEVLPRMSGPQALHLLVDKNIAADIVITERTTEVLLGALKGAEAAALAGLRSGESFVTAYRELAERAHRVSPEMRKTALEAREKLAVAQAEYLAATGPIITLLFSGKQS